MMKLSCLTNFPTNIGKFANLDNFYQKSSNFSIFAPDVSSALWFPANALADPAADFGGGQLGEGGHTRVPPKLKTQRI